jgi:inorganic pyrophosphatase
MLSEIQHFFQVYKDLEGKRVEMGGWEKSEVAMREIMTSIGRYEAVQPKVSGG